MREVKKKKKENERSEEGWVCGEDAVELHQISSLDENPGCTSVDQLISFLKDSRSHQPQGEFYAEN